MLLMGLQLVRIVSSRTATGQVSGFNKATLKSTPGYQEHEPITPLDIHRIRKSFISLCLSQTSCTRHGGSSLSIYTLSNCGSPKIARCSVFATLKRQFPRFGAVARLEEDMPSDPSRVVDEMEASGDGTMADPQQNDSSSTPCRTPSYFKLRADIDGAIGR
jgi:hypothetical protein